MIQYYETLDNSEVKKMKDQSKNRLTELIHGNKQHIQAQKSKDKEEEKKIEEENAKGDYKPLTEFMDATGVKDIDGEIDHTDQKIMDFLVKDMIEEFEKKKKERPPYCIAPDVMNELGIEDQEGNAVFRIVVMR